MISPPPKKQLKEVMVKTAGPRTSLFVRLSAEVAALAVVVSSIGIWYILHLPAVVILTQPLVDAAADASNSTTLSWTSPGDDGLVGQATSYDARMSTSAITEGNWSSATALSNEPSPKVAGGQESLVVTGLTPATTYYFAVKTLDEQGNQSALSNIASIQTSCTEAWSCAEWSACGNGNQTRICNDLNQCGTTTGKPAETRNCSPCIEAWVCSNWSTCSNGTQTRTCNDQNNCGSTDTKPEEVQTCGSGGGVIFQDLFYVATPTKDAAPELRILKKDGSLDRKFFPFSRSFRGGVSVAVGDLGVDAVDEIVAAPGPGREPEVRIFTKRGELINKFFAFNKSFRGGVHVAIGNVDGKPGKEIIVSAASKGGPEVRIFGYSNGKYSQVVPAFQAYSKRLRGSWNIATGDLDGNGRDEIITVPGENTTSPVVKYFALESRRMVAKTNGVQVFPRNFRGGVTIASADVDGNGKDEVLAAPEGRGGPQLRILGRRSNGSFALISNGFYLFHPSFKGGVSLSSGDVDNNGRDDIIAAVRSGDRSLIRVFRSDGKKLFSEFLAFPKELTTGINVAGGHFLPPE